MTSNRPAWVPDAVFYQVFPDRLAQSGRVRPPGELEPWDAPPTVHGFKGGDLYGVLEHLDRLQRLGVNALYLNPVFTSGANHRYHTDDYLSVDPLLGGNQALRELVDEIHARGMRIMLDGVFNHCGRGWPPFTHLLENGAASPYRDWFHLADDVRSGERHLSAFPTPVEFARIAEMREAGKADGEASRVVLGYEAWWDLPALPKLNLENPLVRDYILDVAETWTRFGVDGWRLDVAEEVSDTFWREFHQRVRSVDPDAYLVAEVWHHKPEWLQGDMFHAFMNYPLALAILGFAGQGRVELDMDLPIEYEGELRPFDGAALWARIDELYQLNGSAVSAVQLNLLGSHDTPRVRTLMGGGLDALRLAVLLQMTLPGAPCIYYGDEIGLEGGMDPYCRAGFPVEPTAWEAAPYHWTADLVALRHASPALRDGAIDLLGVQDAAVAYLRRSGDEVLAVVANAGDDPLSWELTLPVAASGATVVPLPGAASGDVGARLHEETLEVAISGRDGTVIRLETD